MSFQFADAGWKKELNYIYISWPFILFVLNLRWHIKIDVAPAWKVDKFSGHSVQDIDASGA